ncbi:UNVERIFIED_CONTAM: hypothetical protein PYX00_008500 [Menopon gallinae]|uniref:Integrase catalytic domain-containing protein n=1 Tax=Menopon gallinae TaxID=328185 RepID=A0AAW2HN92_9NEOP
MDLLLRQRRSLRSKATKLKNLIDEVPDQDSLRHIEEKLNLLSQDFEALHQELLRVAPEEEVDTIIEEHIEDTEKIWASVNKIQKKTAQGIQRNNAPTEVRLPQIDLPTFSGDPTEWFSFHDLFRATIHENPNLSNAQRLQYLKGTLRGEAAKIIRHLPITEDSYVESWDLLKRRYNNTRYIANTTVQRLLNLQGSKHGNQQLNNLLDVYNEVDKTLKALVPNQNRWELIVMNILTNNMDSDSRQAWELSLQHTDIPSLEELLRFLEVRSRALGITSRTDQGTGTKCPVCNGDHAIYRCQKFEKAGIEQRRQTVNRLNLCFNCLSPKHRSQDCKARGCHKCSKKHHTFLHSENTSLSVWNEDATILLPTAELQINKDDQLFKVRSLLDSGSQFNLISGNLAKILQLKRHKVSLSARTAAGNFTLPETVDITIDMPKFKRKIKCYVVDKLTVTLPSIRISTAEYEHLKDLQLADKKFFEPGNIDIILGMGITSELLMEGLRKGASNQPIAQKTAIGWTVSGYTKNPNGTSPGTAALYSDNGRNFVAANRYLRDVFNNHLAIENFATNKGIQWNFIPPYSPHMGGLWEAGVKSIKYHMKRVMGQTTPTLEELYTLLCKIEACLNSRPLCPLTEDPDNLEALTPGHFLIGEPLNSLPESTKANSGRLIQRYRHQQKLIRDLWKRWNQEYLATLQAKTKWKIKSDPLSVGDLVVLKDPNTPPQFWKLGRIIKTHPDNENQVRVVSIKTAGGTTKRNITRIVKLFSDNGHSF